MGDYNAYQSAELAALYDAVYADCGDVAFWQSVAAEAGDGPVLELACGTGRVLLPLARAGRHVTGLDLAPHMLARCREKLRTEPADVRGRVTLLEADMTSFEIGRRFALICCAFGSFHHLRAVDQQLACLERCSEHLLPTGVLVLDLINPEPAPIDGGSESAEEGATPGTVDWTDGRRVRSWATVVSCDRSLQCNDVEVTYEVVETDESVRRLSERFPIRFVFRYELEHLLARCGFRIAALYGDYDRSALADDSPGIIVVAEPLVR